MGILVATFFEINPTQDRLKVYNMGRLIFCCDMIIQIKHKSGWLLICQIKQTQINYDNNRENMKWVDYGNKVSDKVILRNKATYKYETPYK